MEKQIKTIKIITILSIIVMFVCIIILTCQLIKIGNLKEQNKELTYQKEQLLDDIYNYNTSNAYYGNNRQEFLENYARESMFYGKDGEVWYTKQ